MKNTATKSASEQFQLGARTKAQRWKLPLESHYLDRALDKRRSKRFLNFMERKIELLMLKDPRKAWICYERFSRKSRLWTLYILNKVDKSYFLKYGLTQLIAKISRYLKKLRLKKYHLEVERIYIPKSNGKKRPIGAPKFDSKMIYIMVSEFILKWLEPKIGPYQHGFRPGRGMLTASKALLEGLRKGKKVFEFDMTAFFNNLNAEIIGRNLKKEIPELGDWIRYCTRFTIPLPREVFDESDKELWRAPDDGKTENWIRRGFTQGANWSPMLSIYALELARFNQIPGLIMYADDGLVLRDEEEHIDMNSPKWGIRVNPDKPMGWTKVFTFLGLKYDLSENTVTSLNGMKADIGNEEECLKLIKENAGEQKKSRPNPNVITYGNKGWWAWKGRDKSLALKSKIYDGTSPIIYPKGVIFVNECTIRGEMNGLLLPQLNASKQWGKPQWVKINPPLSDSQEAEKLFGATVTIKGKKYTQMVGR